MSDYDHDCDPVEIERVRETTMGRCKQCGRWFRSSSVWRPLTSNQAAAVLMWEEPSDANDATP